MPRAEPQARGPARARARRTRALRDRLRQRRLLDLLRARRHGRLRARPDAARLRHRRPDLRGTTADVRRGDGSLPGGRRVVELRAPRVQRARELRGRVGADAQLRDHDLDLGVLRPALPLDLLGAAADEPLGHHRRRRRDRRSRRDQRRRRQGGGGAQHHALGDRLRDSGAARDHRVRARSSAPRRSIENVHWGSRRPGASSRSRSRSG